ncbi:MAG: GNAT family N-acetyltransferase [Myxococcota bacterium]
MDPALPRLTSDTLEVLALSLMPADAVLQYYVRNRAHLEPVEPLRPSDFYTVEHWTRRAVQAVAELRGDRALRLVVVERDAPDTVVGVINYTNIIRGPFQACMLGFSLDERAQGRGIMTRALQLSVHHVFDVMNLHRIMANHMPRNLRSASVLQRLGFQREGLAAAYVRIHGAWEDHVLNSLVNPTWRETNPD